MPTKIPYAKETCNASVGCTHSGMPGCDNCFAEKLHTMRHKAYLAGKKVPKQYAKPFNIVQLMPERLEQVLRWRKPRRIFWCSMSDLFHEDVPFEFIDQIHAVMALTPQHRHLILTKRVQGAFDYYRKVRGGRYQDITMCMQQFMNSDYYDFRDSCSEQGFVLPNVWLGISCSTQDDLNKMLPILLQIPGRHWLSLEPLLEDIDVSYQGTGITCPECKGKRYITNRKHWMHPSKTGDGLGENWCLDCNNLTTGINPIVAGIHWVVIGCESGSKRRPCNIEWVRSVVEQCEGPEVPVYVKQLEINGKLVTDPKDFPADMRIRGIPK